MSWIHQLNRITELITPSNPLFNLFFGANFTTLLQKWGAPLAIQRFWSWVYWSLPRMLKFFFCVFWVKVYYGLFLLGTMHRHLFSSLVGLFSSIKPSKSTWDQIPELINFGRFTLRVFKRGVTENQPFIFIDFPEKHLPCGNFQLPWMIRVYHGVPWISPPSRPCDLRSDDSSDQISHVPIFMSKLSIVIPEYDYAQNNMIFSPTYIFLGIQRTLIQGNHNDVSNEFLGNHQILTP